MRNAIVFGAVLLVAAAGPVFAEDDTDLPLDDATSQGTTAQLDTEPTDAETDTREASKLVDISGPLAFGVVYSDGTKQSGTANWTSSYNSTYKRYEITITGENYYYTKYATVITPAGDARFCRSSSVSGKLLVYCYDANGVSQTSRLGFITLKP